MLDLFRKEEINSLKARIAELEEENRKLSLQLEKRDERARKTVATKQEVDRELNECRQRVSSLENELLKLKKEPSSGLSFRFSENMAGKKLEDILYLLGSMESKTATLITICLAGNDTLKSAPHDIANKIDSKDSYLVEKIESPTGKVVFYDTDGLIRLVMLPVFPLSRSEYYLERRFNIEILRKNLEGEKTLVVNAHAGETFIGIAEAHVFVEHKVIRSSVMGKHSKGGWSQKRFQSLVEEDVMHHADKVRSALVPIMEKHKDINYVIAGGEGKLIKTITEGYDYPLIIRSMEAVFNAEQVLREATGVRVYWI